MEIHERYKVLEINTDGMDSFVVADKYYMQIGLGPKEFSVCATYSFFHANMICIALNSCQEEIRNIFENSSLASLDEGAIIDSRVGDDLKRFCDFNKKYDLYKGLWIVKEEDGSYKVQSHINGEGWAVGAFASVESAESYIDEATR